MKNKIYCFFGRHEWSEAENNICSVCGKVAIGLPKFVNPPAPPKAINHDFFCESGYLQIPPVKNMLPLPPILLEEEVEVGLQLEEFVPP